MVKLAMVLVVALALAGGAQAAKPGRPGGVMDEDRESQGNRTNAKKFGLETKGVRLLSRRLIYGKMASTCKNKAPSDRTPVDADNITDVDVGKKCGLNVKIKEGPGIALDDATASEMPAEPTCAAGDNNATKVKKVKDLRAHRALRIALVHCAEDLRLVCGFGSAEATEKTCTEQVLNKCPTILTTVDGVPSLDAAALCACEKDNEADLGACFKNNQGLGNGRLLFGSSGGGKPDTDTESKGQLGGAIRSIRNCFSNNTEVLTPSCKAAMTALDAKHAAEKDALDAAAAAAAAAPAGRRQLQGTVSFTALQEAAEQLDPASGGLSSASGLGAPLALALAVLALNRN
jgi:hypothetical protein